MPNDFHHCAYWCFGLCCLGFGGSLGGGVCLGLGGSSLLRDSGLLCLGSGSLGFGGLGLCDLGLCILGSLFLLGVKSGTSQEITVAVRTLTAAFFSPAGLAAGLVSLTGPEGPVWCTLELIKPVEYQSTYPWVVGSHPSPRQSSKPC